MESTAECKQEICKICNLEICPYLSGIDVDQRRYSIDPLKWINAPEFIPKAVSSCTIDPMDCNTAPNDGEPGDIAPKEDDKICGICLEKPVPERQFGILPNCSHIFCLQCIQKWRMSKDDGIMVSCPMCRTSSDFIYPSTVWVEDHEEKNRRIVDYKKTCNAIGSPSQQLLQFRYQLVRVVNRHRHRRYSARPAHRRYSARPAHRRY